MVDHLDDRQEGYDQNGLIDRDGVAALNPIRRRGRGHKVLIGCSIGFCTLTAVLVVCVGLFVGFIAHSPIVIGGLGSRIASALQERFGHGAVFILGPTSLVSRGVGPTFGIDGLTISGGGEEKFLSAPRAEVSVDAASLLFGKVVPKRLEVFDLELRLVLLKDGSVAIAAGKGSKPFFELRRPADAAEQDEPTIKAGIDPLTGTAVQPRRAIVMKQAARSIRLLFDAITNPNSPIAAVDRIGINGGRLVFEDQAANEEVVYKGLDLDFDKTDGGTTLSVSAEGPSQRWSIAAEAKGLPGAARHFKIDLKNFSQDELQLAAGTRSLGFDTDVPISMNFAFGLNANDTLSEATGQLDLGSGFFRAEDPDHEPLLFDKITAGVHWNGETRHIEIDQIAYDAGTTKLRFAGSMLPPLNEGEPWTIGIATSEPGVLGPDRLGEQPVVIDRGQLSARLFPTEKKFVIDRFGFGTGTEGGFALAGQIDWINGPHVRFGASIDPTSVRVAKRIWPPFVAAPVRAWMLAHFNGGTIQTGTMKIDYTADDLLRMRSDRAPPDDSVSLDFTVAKAQVQYLAGAPPIEDATGTGHLSGRHALFKLTSGSLDANGRKIQLSDGTFTVLDADIHPTPAQITAHVTGSVEAITDVLSRDAMKSYVTLPLNPATLKGQADGRLEETLFLGDHNPKDTALRVDATITNFVADRLVGKEKLDNATVTIAVDPTGLKASGQGRIFGGPATFEISKSGDKAPDAVVNVTLDDAARAKLGMAAIPGLTGPMSARIATTLGQNSDKMKAQVDVDLGKTAITAAFLGLSKPAGKPAKVTTTVTAGNDRLALDPLVLDVGSVQGRGAVELGADNAFQAARFSSLKFSPGDDMKVDVAKADDMFKLTIRGSTIDARPFLHALTQITGDNTPLAKNAKAEHKEADSFKGFDIDMKTGILTGFNKEVMSDVELRLSKRGSQIRQFSVDGKFGRSTVSGSMGANQQMRVSTQDAGSLVSFIDLYKHMEGGLLTSSMLVGDETLKGSLDIQHFVLRDEPAMKKLVAQSVESSQPDDSAGKAARSVDANAVTFTRLKVNFQRAGSRLELKDATMYGSAIGLSVDGWLDYAHDRVSMAGTFVPAFAVNNIFSQVPVLGFFLGGASNEGLFAITFKISGLASSPTLSVNPLSAIAPGFLRKIFGALDQGGAPGVGAEPAGR